MPASRTIAFVASSPNVTGTLSLNVLGHVPLNPIDDIFYEKRGQDHELLPRQAHQLAAEPADDDAGVRRLQHLVLVQVAGIGEARVIGGAQRIGVGDEGPRVGRLRKAPAA